MHHSTMLIRAMGHLLMFSLFGGFLPAGQAGLLSVLAAEEASNPYGAVRLSRLSFIEGEVLLQRGDDEEWVAASVNMPLRPHDKLWATDGARAEIQFDDGTAVRLAENSNLDLLDLETGWTHFQLTLGVASFAVRSASQRDRSTAFLEVDTPQAVVQADRSGRFRLDVAEDGSTQITVRQGKIELGSDQEPIVVGGNQRVLVESGDSPRYLLEAAQERDEWDRWNENRDDQLARAKSREHLSPGIAMGTTELDTYGQWTMVPTYGRVWAPRVSVGWVPYQAGRWVWVEPWGWTWVSYEPWGWIPYHHGRWAVVSSVGWVWVPGPALEAWSPGYVRFIHGPDWVAWVPLAPGEVYYYNPGISVHVELNLINYRAPGAVIVLPRRTFVTGVPIGKKFVAPRDPIRAGRVVAGPPPIVPTRASLRPAPQRVVRIADLPPRTIQRPVVYRRAASPPPPLFESRIKELKTVVQQGRPPIAARPRPEETRAPEPERPGAPEKIHKGITVRKPIKGAAKEETRPTPKPPAEKREPLLPSPRPPDKQAAPPELKNLGQPHVPRQFDLDRKPPGQPDSARPLYREPPKIEKRTEPVVPEQRLRLNGKAGERANGRPDGKQR